MPEQTLSALEFPGLIGVVQQYAVSALGRSLLGELHPLPALDQIKLRFQEIRELKDLEDREGPPPLADFPDLSPWLAKAQVRGSLLPPEAFNDLLAILGLARNLSQYLALGSDSYPRLTALAGNLKDLTLLREAIRQSISPHNFILDTASPELAAVRRELADTRERVQRRLKQTFFKPEYQEALQSPLISQRHGRYVIPVKADHKGAIPGIIHDQSQTRATLYLEPLSIVEDNNALNLLANREKREEEAVLRRLTDRVRHHLEDLRLTQAGLAALDAIEAKVRFARDFQAREPIWRGGQDGGLHFREARHPLLVQRQKENPAAPRVVPIDLRLTPESRFLIISGANAGGKTVALKTLGLLTLMVQSGIPIPVAEGSEFAPFDQVFADIGDPQDLSQDLSTFSAHLQRALAMLAAAPGRALVLLDELGTATDPNEGGALAVALLRAFNQRGAYGAVTTHLPLLKSLASRTPGFENVAVIFDEETRRPTYRLAYGVAGVSNALKIARELGLSPEILEMAEGYLDREELKAFRLLAEVEAAQQHLALKEAELARRESDLSGQADELEEQRRELDTERRRLAEEVRQKALDRIKEAEAQFKNIVQRLQEGAEPWGKLRVEFSRRQAELLQDLQPAPGPETRPQPEFAPGQPVFLPALGLTGEVLGPAAKDGRLEVRVRQVKLKVAPEEAVPVRPEPGTGRAVPGLTTYSLPPERLPTLNVVGLRVDEALPLVDRLLDQAVLHGAERVDIIHGLGTGRLKKAVREHLQHHSLVKAVHGDDNPGVTVVDLK
jgi:DNA mismatch repair protein MutS2